MKKIDLENGLELAKKAAVQSGRLLLNSKQRLNKLLDASSKDTKLAADIEYKYLQTYPSAVVWGIEDVPVGLIEELTPIPAEVLPCCKQMYTCNSSVIT